MDIVDGAISESVWNNDIGATGGGVSTLYPVPDWQSGAKVPASVNPGGGTGRGVPDVAGNADPDTGYLVGSPGSLDPIGGTSAVAPLWAALIARLNQHLGTSLGFLNPLLYESLGSNVFNDVPKGTNGGYHARPNGWDACTGLGTPRGTDLLKALARSN